MGFLKSLKKGIAKTPLGGISGLVVKSLNVTPGLIKKSPVKAAKRSAILLGAGTAALNPVGAASIATKLIPTTLKGKVLGTFSAITGATVLAKSKKARKVVSKAPETFVKTATTGGTIIAKTIETGKPGISTKDALVTGGLAAGAVVGGVAIARTAKAVKEKALVPGAVAALPTPLPQKSSIENPPGAATAPIPSAATGTPPKMLPNIDIDINIDNRKKKKFINQQVLIK